MFNNHKIIISKNFVRVIEYENLLLISDDRIIIDNNEIFGSVLHISEMDEYTILINGKIKGVKILDDED